MIQSLQGKKILVTREASQAKQFSDLITNSGGVPIEVPLLSIRCLEQTNNNINIDQFTWIFFTSAHGVNCFFNQFSNENFEDIKFATVGHKTEKALKSFGFEAEFIPSTYNADVMAKEFFETYPDVNDVLLVRGNISRKLLVKELSERNLGFNTCVVYETAYNLEMKDKLIRVIQEKNIDLLTFTSPSTVKAFMKIMEDHPNIQDIFLIPCACIGTTTEQTAKKFGFTTTIVPNTFTIESMVERMKNYIHMEEI
ncbi:uroporphyrinogen-III synthase [Pseudogracilibacillus sp. SO30301A]|uniref:uroporphyrinogen-III synthase n=1 Tax=Pseudogracilibacillus sp. SO30301A TaxID=3098291 RepID=UPI00300DE1DA